VKFQQIFSNFAEILSAKFCYQGRSADYALIIVAVANSFLRETVISWICRVLCHSLEFLNFSEILGFSDI